MADTILDNARAEQAGFPKIPRDYDKAMEMIGKLSDFADDFYNKHGGYSKNDSDLRMSVSDFLEWLRNSVANFFGKTRANLSDDRRRWIREHYQWNPNKGILPWVTTPAEGMKESPLETSMRLHQLEEKLDRLDLIQRCYRVNSEEGDTEQKNIDLEDWFNFNQPLIGVVTSGPEGDVTWDMLDKWFGKDFILDPWSGFDIDKPLPKHWYESIPYEVEDE